MKTEKKTGGAILTLAVAQAEATTISDWVAEQMGRTVVELKQPGGAALEIYFDNTTEAEIAAVALERFPTLGKSIREYAAEEWTESWKKHFKPMDVGERLRVCPPWQAESEVRDQKSEVRDQKSAVSGKRIEIVVNPGLSFGTGNHFTTRFCLEQLDRFVPEINAKTLLDVGTGSGVLAVAAVKLGVERAVGVDFDPVCVECAIENAQVNGVAEQTEFFQHDITLGWPPDALRESVSPVGSVRALCIGDDASLTMLRTDPRTTDPIRASDETYDIVCANIYASLLIEHARTLLRITGNYLLLTGIREVEIDGVADTFVRLGGRELMRDGDGDWSGLVIGVS